MGSFFISGESLHRCLIKDLVNRLVGYNSTPQVRHNFRLA